MSSICAFERRLADCLFRIQYTATQQHSAPVSIGRIDEKEKKTARYGAAAHSSASLILSYSRLRANTAKCIILDPLPRRHRHAVLPQYRRHIKRCLHLHLHPGNLLVWYWLRHRHARQPDARRVPRPTRQCVSNTHPNIYHTPH
jgi:hypothetical protein